MGVCSSKTATSPQSETVTQDPATISNPIQIDPNQIPTNEIEHDKTSPTLPKFVIRDPVQPIQTQPEEHHNLLLDEPAMDASAVAKLAAREADEKTEKLRERQYEEIAKRNKLATQNPQVKSIAANQNADKPKRRVKGVLEQIAKKTKEYEFNDDKEAQMVANKGRSVFDQIEQQENAQLKEKALKRPGSAGGREKDIDME
ncbi:hypothetical protein SS50377_23197 [Spironucleus salmonicida]|uniref:Uncharacterized protein n=1 Tax=Spironucleus salmonicida TaxID=348837 RepID=V6LPY0_9EUKA|nr:hypothetical protein SS50377_23197 [Spironucleus salmonicida]|eukprot:EST46298.1 Hypothetical protein SS50377_13684 [Spironucleus salmonicida]